MVTGHISNISATEMRMVEGTNRPARAAPMTSVQVLHIHRVPTGQFQGGEERFKKQELLERCDPRGDPLSVQTSPNQTRIGQQRQRIRMNISPCNY